VTPVRMRGSRELSKHPLGGELVECEAPLQCRRRACGDIRRCGGKDHAKDIARFCARAMRMPNSFVRVATPYDTTL